MSTSNLVKKWEPLLARFINDDDHAILASHVFENTESGIQQAVSTSSMFGSEVASDIKQKLIPFVHNALDSMLHNAEFTFKYDSEGMYTRSHVDTTEDEALFDIFLEFKRVSSAHIENRTDGPLNVFPLLSDDQNVVDVGIVLNRHVSDACRWGSKVNDLYIMAPSNVIQLLSKHYSYSYDGDTQTMKFGNIEIILDEQISRELRICHKRVVNFNPISFRPIIDIHNLYSIGSTLNDKVKFTYSVVINDEFKKYLRYIKFT